MFRFPRDGMDGDGLRLSDLGRLFAQLERMYTAAGYMYLLMQDDVPVPDDGIASPEVVWLAMRSPIEVTLRVVEMVGTGTLGLLVYFLRNPEKLPVLLSLPGAIKNARLQAQNQELTARIEQLESLKQLRDLQQHYAELERDRSLVQGAEVVSPWVDDPRVVELVERYRREVGFYATRDRRPPIEGPGEPRPEESQPGGRGKQRGASVPIHEPVHPLDSSTSSASSPGAGEGGPPKGGPGTGPGHAQKGEPVHQATGRSVALGLRIVTDRDQVVPPARRETGSGRAGAEATGSGTRGHAEREKC